MAKHVVNWFEIPVQNMERAKKYLDRFSTSNLKISSRMECNYLHFP